MRVVTHVRAQRRGFPGQGISRTAKWYANAMREEDSVEQPCSSSASHKSLEDLPQWFYHFVCLGTEIPRRKTIFLPKRREDVKAFRWAWSKSKNTFLQKLDEESVAARVETDIRKQEIVEHSTPWWGRRSFSIAHRSVPAVLLIRVFLWLSILINNCNNINHKCTYRTKVSPWYRGVIRYSTTAQRRVVVRFDRQRSAPTTNTTIFSRQELEINSRIK